jgi:hypothetical protein
MQWELPRSIGGLWLFIAIGAATLWRKRRFVTLLLFVLVTGAVTTAAWAVHDIQRSLGFLLPAVLVGLVATAQREMDSRDIREISIVAFVLCFLLPVTSFFSVRDYDYAPGNLLPVELARFIHYLRLPN